MHDGTSTMGYNPTEVSSADWGQVVPRAGPFQCRQNVVERHGGEARGGVAHLARGEEFTFVQQFTGDFLSHNGSSNDSACTTFKSATTLAADI